MISPIGIVAALLMRDRSVFCVSLIFSFGIVGSILHRIVGQIIFPAQLIAKRSWGCTMRLLVNAGLEEVLVGSNGIHELDKRKRALIEVYGGRPVQIRTPDGVLLDAVLFVAPDQELSSSVVIHLNANMQLMEAAASAGLIQMYHQHQVNVLLFNYRGVGLSSGSISRDGVLVDAESVFQFVHNGLHVPEDRIVVHARSIGGGVGLGLAKLHPRIAICSERSFASLQQVIRIVLSKALGIWTQTTMLSASVETACEDGLLSIGATSAEAVETEDSSCKCAPLRRGVLELMLWFVTIIGN